MARDVRIGVVCSCVLLVWAAALTLSAQTTSSRAKRAVPAGKLRTYYIAADEVEWDYAPSNQDHMSSPGLSNVTERESFFG